MRESGSIFDARDELERVFAGFARANANHVGQFVDENLAITNLTRLGRSHDGIEHEWQIGIGNHHFDLDLGDKIDSVFGASVHLGVPFLATETPNLANGHAVNAALGQGILDVFEFEVTNNGFNFFHDVVPECEPWRQAGSVASWDNEFVGFMPRKVRQGK
jgi:hypothetical protein